MASGIGDLDTRLQGKWCALVDDMISSRWIVFVLIPWILCLAESSRDSNEGKEHCGFEILCTYSHEGEVIE